MAGDGALEQRSMIHTALLDRGGWVVQMWMNQRPDGIDGRGYSGTIMGAPPEVCPGWRWNGKAFVPPPPAEGLELAGDNLPSEPEQEVKVPVPQIPIEPKPYPKPIPPQPIEASVVPDQRVPYSEQVQSSLRDILTRAELGDDPLEPMPEDEPEPVQAQAPEPAPAPAYNPAPYTIADQIRYELAMQARNGSIRAISLFEEEAKRLGVTVTVLAENIIEDRQRLEEQMMRAI